MRRRIENDFQGPAMATARCRALLTLARRGRFFARDEDGSLIIFGLFMFMLMLAIAGLSLDLMRFEANRERLQSTLDQAVLAAASLSQELDPKEVVEQYFAKAGMDQYLDSVTVTEGLNMRRVEAHATILVPMHHGAFSIMGGIEEADTLVAEATSVAEESIGNVEISMVLDVSGSMNSYSRLTNLKSAAKGFIDTIYDAAQPGAVSTSIIPYATQSNAGAELLSYFQRNDSHEHSHCVNFSTSDFTSASMADHLIPSLNPAGTPIDQATHFDPWTTESTSFDLGENLPYLLCPTDNDGYGNREFLLWSADKTALKTYIDGFVADGNTSTDVGTKWGAALIDPGAQPILTGMIGSGTVDSGLAGRPYDYDDPDALKVLVVMTDGAHTNQYYMSDFRSGPSFVWKYVQGGVIHYSIWYDGEGSTPITNPSGNYSYCRGSSWYNGSCGDWEWGSNPDFWFHAYSDDAIENTYGWRSTPYGGSDAVRMDWSDVWAEIPPEYFSDEVLWEMASLNSTERNAYEYAVDSYGKSTKDSRFDAICAAVKTQDVILFTIGLEVTSSNAARLRSCATSPSYYYNVNTLDISLAFQSIASAINQLRLTQ